MRGLSLGLSLGAQRAGGGAPDLAAIFGDDLLAALSYGQGVFTTSAGSTAAALGGPLGRAEGQPGVNAIQPTNAARPILGRRPAGGRRNLLERTEEFDNAVWSKPSGLSVEHSATPGPAAVASAQVWRVSNPDTNRAMLQNPSSAIQLGQAKSIWARTVSGTGTVALLGFNGFEKYQFSLTEEWQRFEAPSDPGETGGGSYYTVDFRFGTLSEVLVAAPQLDAGSTVTPYQRVGASWDVTEAGKASISTALFGTGQFLRLPSLPSITILTVGYIQPGGTPQIVEQSSVSGDWDFGAAAAGLDVGENSGLVLIDRAITEAEETSLGKWLEQFA